MLKRNFPWPHCGQRCLEKQRPDDLYKERSNAGQFQNIFDRESPLEQRLPPGFPGLALNFRRIPACASYGIHPDPFKRRNGAPKAPAGVLGSAVAGAKHDAFFKCPTCKRTSRIKNNRAISEEHKAPQVFARAMGESW